MAKMSDSASVLSEVICYLESLPIDTLNKLKEYMALNFVPLKIPVSDHG